MADLPLAPWLDKKEPAAPAAAPDAPVAPWVAKKKDTPAPSSEPATAKTDAPLAPWVTKPDSVAGAKGAPAPPRAGAPAAPDAGGVAAPLTPSAPLTDQITAAEKANDIPPGLLNQVLTTESGLKPGAVNIQGSGATGLAQIKPATAADPGYGIKPVNPNDPADSIRFAGQYLAALKKKTGSWAEAVKAYGTVGATPANEQQARVLALAQGADQPFRQPRDVARETKPDDAGSVLSDIGKAGSETYQTEQEKERKAGIPFPYIGPAIAATATEAGVATSKAFDVFTDAVTSLGKQLGLDPGVLGSDISALLQSQYPELPHIARGISERAPPGEPRPLGEPPATSADIINLPTGEVTPFTTPAAKAASEASLQRKLVQDRLTTYQKILQDTVAAKEQMVKEYGAEASPDILKEYDKDIAAHEKEVTRLKLKLSSFGPEKGGVVKFPGPPPGEPPFAGPPPGEPPAEPPPPTRADITAKQTELADRLHAHNQGVTADRIETMELGKAAQKAIPDQALREKLIHHQEQPDKVPLTPEEKGLFDQHILPIIRAREEVQNKIADLGGRPHYPAWPALREGEDIAHAPRFVKGKGSTIDWLLQGLGRRVGRQSLSKVGDKSRTVPGPMIDNPKVAYYKDAVVNNLVKLEESKRQLRNMQMLEHLKSDPGLDHLREPTKEGGFGQTPGWKTAGPPQLAGIHWHPRIANAINDAFKTFQRSGDAATFYAHVNRILVGSMFYSPIGHILNVFTDTLVSKGAIGTVADLVTGRSFKAFGKAVREVGTLGKDYRANLRAGSSLQYGGVATENFVSDLVKGLEKQIKIDPKSWAEIARAGGYANPANLVAGIYRASRKFLWGAGDVLKLTRQYELEAEGMSRAEAIKETEKHIVSYRPPTEVAGQRWLSELIQNPYVFSFSRYHYGLLKSLASTARDIAVGTGEERLRAIDSAIMMGVVYLGYRAIDDRVRKLVGNKNASVKRSGVFGLEDVAEKFAEGDKDARDVLQRVASLNPAFKLLATLYEGKDPYTGRDVIRGRDLLEHPVRFAKEIGTVLGSPLMPIKEGIDLARGKTTPQEEILKQLNITDPSQANRARIARHRADIAQQRSLRRQFGN